MRSGPTSRSARKRAFEDRSLRRTRSTIESSGSATGRRHPLNQDQACLPQDETSIYVNPADDRNVSAGRTTTGSAGGRRASTRRPTRRPLVRRDHTVPVAYQSGSPGPPRRRRRPSDRLRPRRGPPTTRTSTSTATDDTSGICVSRSTNGGFTWSRPCVAREPTTRPESAAATATRASRATARSPSSRTRRIAERQRSVRRQGVHRGGTEAGGRRAAVLHGRSQHTHGVRRRHVGPDRLYITWTRFDAVGSQIMLSYSDDRARSWSPAKVDQRRRRVLRRRHAAGMRRQPGLAASGRSARRTAPSTSPSRTSTRLTRTSTWSSSSTDGGQTFRRRCSSRRSFDVNYPQAGAAANGPTAPLVGRRRDVRADEHLLPRQRPR